MIVDCVCVSFPLKISILEYVEFPNQHKSHPLKNANRASACVLVYSSVYVLARLGVRDSLTLDKSPLPLPTIRSYPIAQW